MTVKSVKEAKALVEKAMPEFKINTIVEYEDAFVFGPLTEDGKTEAGLTGIAVNKMTGAMMSSTTYHLKNLGKMPIRTIEE